MKQQLKYGITGMTCGHCVKSVTEEVSALDGVSDVKIDLVDGGDFFGHRLDAMATGHSSDSIFQLLLHFSPLVLHQSLTPCLKPAFLH